MTQYNEIVKVSNETCVSSNDFICLEWNKTENTFLPFALPLLIVQITIFFVIIVSMIRVKK